MKKKGKEKYLKDRLPKINVGEKDLFTGGSYHKDVEDYFNTNLPSVSIKEVTQEDLEQDPMNPSFFLYRVKEHDNILIMRVSELVAFFEDSNTEGHPITIVNENLTDGVPVAAEFFNMQGITPSGTGTVRNGETITVVRYKNRMYLLNSAQSNIE